MDDTREIVKIKHKLTGVIMSAKKGIHFTGNVHLDPYPTFCMYCGSEGLLVDKGKEWWENRYCDKCGIVQHNEHGAMIENPEDWEEVKEIVEPEKIEFDLSEAKRGHEYYGLPENFDLLNRDCGDLVYDKEFMKVNSAYRNRAMGKKLIICIDCIFVSKDAEGCDFAKEAK